MSYKTRRYKEGLSGGKPGWFDLDEEGHRAQEAGYRDYLRNQDLADRIREASRDHESDHDDSPRTPVPISPSTRVVRIFVSFVLALLALGAFNLGNDTIQQAGQIRGEEILAGIVFWGLALLIGYGAYRLFRHAVSPHSKE